MIKPDTADPRKQREQRHQSWRALRKARRIGQIDRRRGRIKTRPTRRWGRLAHSNDTDNGSSVDGSA